MNRLLALSFFMVLLSLLPGCRHFTEARFNRGKGLGEDGVLVIPFSEPRRDRWFGESDNGRTAAEAFKAWAHANAKPNFPTGQGVEQVLRQVAEWPNKEITAFQWKQLTMGLGVKYVLHGQIDELALERPDRIGLVEPRIEASYRLVNVLTARLEYERPGVVIESLKRYESEPPDLVFGADTKLATRTILAKLGEQIGKDLYGYYSE